jgi:DNA-binding transcriptional ArsR family regulator
LTTTTIRFHLPEGAIERVGFSYGPLLEAVFSLHVLVESQRHPLQHPWIRRMRGLPVALRRELAAFAFAFGAAPPEEGTSLPNPLGVWPTDPAETFTDGVAALRALPAETIAAEFAAVAAVGERGAAPATRETVRLVRDDPVAFVARLCTLLEGYWEAAFASEWERLEPQFAESVARAGRLLHDGGLAAFVATLGPRVRAHSGDRGLDVEMWCAPQWGWPAGRPGIDVDVTGTFTFVPSAFSWPHIWFSFEPPWPFGMTYDIPFVATEARPRIPPADLIRVLRACGDDVRLRALRRIAERPRSTQELAPLVGVTESTLSKHLRQLTDAGVVQPRRDGHYVLYHLRRDRIEPLAESLLAYLDGGSVARS